MLDRSDLSASERNDEALNLPSERSEQSRFSSFRGGEQVMGRRICKTCEREGFDSPTCCYCGAPLSTRHEHDHFPVPKRHGGKEVYPVCINCHDLKDRLDFRNWNFDAFCSAFGGLNTEGKIMMARVIAMEYDAKAKLAELEAE